MSQDKQEDRPKPENGEKAPFPPLSLSGSSGELGDGPAEQVGSQIGQYKLLSVLGEGGFGIVYRAEQKEPIRRQAAPKVIKPGMDSKQIIRRFEAERQALALLDHPNIARVFDAGTTKNGRPYFVMEYIKGIPITEFCDRKKLNIEERLQGFLQVCEAIEYAHHKGIIHRDIKPSNILVFTQQDEAKTKIIDFGVAKAISQPLTERTLFTEQGQLIGTPEYMSPEQAELTNLDIDTRSDIYSLGVLLYEILTGMLPFDSKALREAAFDETLRIVRHDDPPRPSTRLSDLGEEATPLAVSRNTDVRTLAKRLHKELEWIPLKAMRKERNRRYKTASELADDVWNYLNGNPLIAGPESATYRFKKVINRHRTVAVSAVMLFVLGVGIIISTIFALMAEHTVGGLEHRLDMAERISKDEARARVRIEHARDMALREAEWAHNEAARAYKELLEVDESNIEAARRFVRLYLTIGRRDRAKELAAKHEIDIELEEAFVIDAWIIDSVPIHHKVFPDGFLGTNSLNSLSLDGRLYAFDGKESNSWWDNWRTIVAAVVAGILLVLSLVLISWCCRRDLRRLEQA